MAGGAERVARALPRYLRNDNTPPSDLAPQERYGREDLDENDQLYRYQNSVRHQDFFLRNLIDQYKGSSLFGLRPEERTLMFSCWNEGGSLASVKGKEEYIYHLDDELEEVFDLSEDPTKSQNLTGERTPEELKERRSEHL